MGKKRGRPAGSYEYRDEKGNPISVFEWRRKNPQTHNEIVIQKRKIKNRIVAFVIPEEHIEIFYQLQDKHKLNSDQLAEKIIIKYLKRRLEKDEQRKN